MQKILKRKRRKKTTFKNYFWGISSSLFFIFSCWILFLVYQLPNIKDLENYKFDLPTKIYDREAELIEQFFVKKRILINKDNIPVQVKQAIIAIEDNHFYSHFGIDLKRILRVILLNLRTVSFAQGASTITQQTAKLFLLSPDRKLTRKIKEILLAFKIERKLEKDEILELYLNKAYMGNGAWGIGAAAKTYFSKDVKELNLTEIATLSGLVKAPSKLAPTNNIDLATNRKNLVLLQMAKLNFISPEQLEIEQQREIELNLSSIQNKNAASYFIEEVRKKLNTIGQKEVHTSGLSIYTTMDKDLQVAGHNALKEGLITIDKRHGYKGVIESALNDDGEISQEKLAEIGLYNRYNQLDDIAKAIIIEVSSDKMFLDLGDIKGRLFLEQNKWAVSWSTNKLVSRYNQLQNFDAFNVGDVILVKLIGKPEDSEFYNTELYQNPINNGALVAIKPQSGEILAMIGGYDFKTSKFNRATQSKRQPGSAFKPIIYAAALDKGYTTASLLEDTPLGFRDYKRQFTWFPKNYGGGFSGNTTLRESLYKSKNIPTVKLGIDLGVKNIIDYTKKFGIKSAQPKDLSISLGSGALSLLELTNAYSVFATGGIYPEPYMITKILDRNGASLYEKKPTIKRVVPASTAYIITSILRDVFLKGTAKSINVFGRPIAGKTGTTNNNTDAWFIGYTPQIVSGVYVGNDTPTFPLGLLETGSRAAAPIWKNFMLQAIKKYSPLDFPQPDGLVKAKIITKSGLLDCREQDSKDTYYEFFKSTTEPVQCDQDTFSTSYKEASDSTLDSKLKADNFEL